MTARYGLTLVAATTVALAGCASGSGGASGDGGDWENPPRDNTHTRSAQLFLTQAQSMGAEERYADALEAANNSILEEPTNPLGYLQAGSAQVGLGDYTAADTLFDRALALYPPYEEDVKIQRESAWIALFNDAIEPLNTGNHEEGVKLLEAAEAIFPNQRPEALINMGVSYANLGRTEDAIDAYGAALELIRGPRTMEADSATAANWRDSESNVSFNRAQLLSQSERYDEAAAEYRVFLETNPGDINALTSLAAVMASAGMADSAQAIYDGLITGGDLSLRDYFNIGVGLYQAQVFDEAAAAFARVAEVSPQNRDAVFNQAQALFEGEAWAELLPVAEQLVNLDSHNSNSYTILAKALIETGDEQEAVRILEARQALPFYVEGTQLQPRAAGGASIIGEIVNNSLEPGTTVTVRVHFNGDDGAEVGTTDVRISAPAPEAAEAFAADFSSTESVMGYYVEVVSPS